MQRLNHHHLFIFWTFAKTGSFTQTAYELSIAQSAVTKQIQQLEEVLGLMLIDRSNRRRAELTSDGRRVLEYANSIFESSQELIKWATKGEAPKTSTLRVGALSGLSRNLQYEFLKPIVGDVAYRLEVTTGDQENLVRLLREHSMDVILSSHNVRSDGKISFYSHVLTSSPLIFVTADQSLKKNSDLKSCLKQRPLFVPGNSFEVRPELDAFLENLKTPFRIAGDIDDIALLRILALRSGAVVALPEMGVRNDIESNELSVLAYAKGIEQRFYAITRQKRVPNKIIESLIQSMRKS
jgi:LysR family transcriptional regulator, transcriptional activator of nhaA